MAGGRAQVGRRGEAQVERVRAEGGGGRGALFIGRKVRWAEGSPRRRLAEGEQVGGAKVGEASVSS